MSLFEFAIRLPEGVSEDVLETAANAVGYEKPVVTEDTDGVWRLLVSEPGAPFARGQEISDLILGILPAGASVLSHRQAVSISDMAQEDLDFLLAELEKPLGDTP